MAPFRTGLLIIRVWTEEGSSTPLRVDIRTTVHVSKGIESEQTVADADTAVTIVQEWLAQFIKSNSAGAEEA